MFDTEAGLDRIPGESKQSFGDPAVVPGKSRGQDSAKPEQSGEKHRGWLVKRVLPPVCRSSFLFISGSKQRFQGQKVCPAAMHQ